MPYIYCIYLWYSARYDERLKPRKEKLTFLQALAENNAIPLRRKTES